MRDHHRIEGQGITVKAAGIIWLLFCALDFSCAFCPVPLRPCGGPNTRSRASTRLSSFLFSTEFNRDKNDTSSAVLGLDEDDQDVTPTSEKDLSVWVEGLRQWPLYTSPTGGTSSSASNSDPNLTTDPSSGNKGQFAPPSSARYRGSNPLSNLVKLIDVATPTAVDSSKNRTIFSMAEQLFGVLSDAVETTGSGSSSLENVRTIDQLIEREMKLQQSVESANTLVETDAKTDMSEIPTKSSAASFDSSVQQSIGEAAETILRDATSSIEYLVNEASTALSPNTVQDLIDRTSELLFSSAKNSTTLESVSDELVQAAGSIAEERGIDVPLAEDEARETTRYAVSLVSIANNLFAAGYAYGARSEASAPEDSFLEGILFQQQDVTQALPLFAEFTSARRIEPFQYDAVVTKGAEMAGIAGAIYEDTLTRCHELGHSIVANGTTAEVAWLVTDSIESGNPYLEPPSSLPETNNPQLVRTITIRGFDASDETVDREGLLNTICSPAPESISENESSILFHGGLLRSARAIFEDIRKYIEWAPPGKRIVINGHSIGGSLSVLVLLLMTTEYGAEFVLSRIQRVYTHGSPPIAAIPSGSVRLGTGMYECQVLEAFGLPSDIVFGFVQPYDPIVRFMSEYDPLYPLVDDLGADETTLYASGPRRSLRPIARMIFSAWDGWPEFRRSWKSTSPRNQNFQSVGIQHLLLPQPNRYLTDRFISPNVGVPATEAIVRVSSTELLPALNATFPLDTFQISLVPQAVRSFVHHFYPAYDESMGGYATKISKEETADVS